MNQNFLQRKLQIRNLSEDGENVGNAPVADPDLPTIENIMRTISTQNCSRFNWLQKEHNLRKFTL